MRESQQLPECRVIFVCSCCFRRALLDAYRGPAHCRGLEDVPHPPALMIPERVA